VLVYKGSQSKATISGRSKGNFVVRGYSGSDPLVDEVGSYQGTVHLRR
jgi:hypothetical protein